MGNTNKKSFYPIAGTVAGDLHRDTTNALTVLRNTGKVRSYQNGDFTKEELDGIVSGLTKIFPDKKFVLKGRGE